MWRPVAAHYGFEPRRRARQSTFNGETPRELNIIRYALQGTLAALRSLHLESGTPGRGYEPPQSLRASGRVSVPMQDVAHPKAALPPFAGYTPVSTCPQLSRDDAIRKCSGLQSSWPRIAENWQR
jgi:hypothetical protein